MRTAYKVFAWLIALGVVVQAASMVYGVAGLGIWIDKEGGVLDKAAFESDEALFPEVVGLMIHGMNGMMVIPALALLFLIVSFFAKVPGGIMWAALVLGAVVLQVTLGLLGHEAAIWGGLHGINALVLFSLAVYAAVRVPKAVTTRAETTAPERETV
jgi:asparagine N-glycosylation enzyme membrane subunit Stt3